MSPEEKVPAEIIRTAWHAYLMKGTVAGVLHKPWYHHLKVRSLFHRLPKDPRCRLCHAPFKGIGGTVMNHVFGLEPSKMNPELCNECESFARKYQGGAEVEVTILFADVRGSTRLAEQMNPTEFSAIINRFYVTVTKALFDSGAMVEKLIGDAVTGFYTPGISGRNHAHLAVQAAREILRATGHGDPGGPWIPVGIGIHSGMAYVGSVIADSGVADIAVLGDTANTGARLAGLAGAGEIVISQVTAQAAGIKPGEAEMRRQSVKGREEPVDIWVLSPP